MKFSDMPEETRVKLSPGAEEELWEKVEETGIREFADRHSFSSQDLYNWRSKDVFLPKDLVETVTEEPVIEAFKGGGRSKPIEDPVFPLPENPELLTRINESVSVNREGVPVYRTRERSLLNRFQTLLQEFGDVPVSVYSRNGYELRYPKYLHRVLEKMDFEEYFAAAVDESGKVEEGYLKAGARKVSVEEFDGKLNSRDKRLELAVTRGDGEEVERIMREEADKVRKLFG